MLFIKYESCPETFNAALCFSTNANKHEDKDSGENFPAGGKCVAPLRVAIIDVMVYSLNKCIYCRYHHCLGSVVRVDQQPDNTVVTGE